NLSWGFWIFITSPACFHYITGPNIVALFVPQQCLYFLLKAILLQVLYQGCLHDSSLINEVC
ncbi:MAG: hypothetical protein PHE82_09490, partial [Syntrophomonadaceae bacterium]|nr:hypothetical protein [Syntrophomonadaceae bacterium]